MEKTKALVPMSISIKSLLLASAPECFNQLHPVFPPPHFHQASSDYTGFAPPNDRFSEKAFAS